MTWAACSEQLHYLALVPVAIGRWRCAASLPGHNAVCLGLVSEGSSVKPVPVARIPAPPSDPGPAWLSVGSLPPVLALGQGTIEMKVFFGRA